MNPLGTITRTVGMLALLQALLPVDAVLTVGAAIAGATHTGQGGGGSVLPGERRTVMVSGGKMTKALELTRAFHAAGHRVVLVETARYRLTAHRFSRAVDAFHVVPEPTSPDYAAALLDIVQREGVDVFVPVSSPIASWYDARAKDVLAGHCEVVHLDAEPLRQVDDKYEFFRLARDLSLPVPDTHRVTDPRQVADFVFPPGHSYVLKSLAYDPVHRLDLTPLPRPTHAETEAFARSLPISEQNPWILQELLVGDEYCTHGTIREGRLQAYVCCPSSASQLTYTPVDKPAIREWVERFVGATGQSGQLSFDFIEDGAGVVRAIECNPRTHSAITLLHGHPRLADAYLKTFDDGADVVEPAPDATPTYWVHHELWYAMRRPREAGQRLRRLMRGRDAVLLRDDPLPFFLLYHLHLPSLLLQNLRRGRPWVKIDVNIGKLVEPGGD